MHLCIPFHKPTAAQLPSFDTPNTRRSAAVETRRIQQNVVPGLESIGPQQVQRATRLGTFRLGNFEGWSTGGRRGAKASQSGRASDSEDETE
jgi:hypothetical protein